jgi:oligosaccharide repeat unit polymerase
MANRGFILYSPLLVLFSIWAAVFFLYFLNPFNLPTVRFSTILLILMGISSIAVGYMTPKFLSEGIGVKKTSIKVEDFSFNISTLKKVLFVLTLISFIGLAGKMFLFIQQLQDVTAYVLEPNFVRKEFIRAEMGELAINMPLFKLFSHMGSLNPMTVVLGGVLAASPIKRSRFLSVFPVIIAALYSIALLQRVYFVKHYIIWMAASYLMIYFIPDDLKQKAKKIFIKRLFTFVFMIGFFLLFVLIVRQFFVLGSDLDKLLNSFYFYTAGPVFLLDKYLVSDQPLHYGASIFRSFVHWFISLGMMEKSALIPQHYEFYRIYNTIGNAFSFVRIPYEDFGIYGVIIVSYLWGWIGYLVVSKFLSGFSFFRIGFASMVIMSFFWSFYGYAWSHSIGIIIMFVHLSLVDLYFHFRLKK